MTEGIGRLEPVDGVQGMARVREVDVRYPMSMDVILPVVPNPTVFLVVPPLPLSRATTARLRRMADYLDGLIADGETPAGSP